MNLISLLCRKASNQLSGVAKIQNYLEPAKIDS